MRTCSAVARSTIALLLSASVVCIPPKRGWAQITVTPVVLGGDRAHGTPDGVTFSDGNFLDIQLNQAGDVLFIARLEGPGVTADNARGVWIGPPGNVQVGRRTGSEAPGVEAGATFAYVSKLVAAADGGATFYARLKGPGISDDALTSGNDDSIWRLAALSAQQRVGSDTHPAYGYEGVPLLLGRGGWAVGPAAMALIEKDLWLLAVLLFIVIASVVFGGTTRASVLDAPAAETTERAVLSLSPDGTPVVAAVTGATAPGAAETLVSIVAQSAVTNAAGEIAFAGNTTSAAGLWHGTPDALAPVALAGAAVPSSIAAEVGDGATYGSFVGSRVGLNAAGEIAFAAALNVPGEASTFALLAGAPAALRLVARTVESGSPDEGFKGFDAVVLNAAGDVAFTGSHTALGASPGLRGLWATSALGEPALALGEGREAPGLADGEVVSFLEEGPYMNALGMVVMRTGIGSAAGFENTTDHAIWLVDPDDGAQVVARTGAELDIGGGDLRLLDSVSFISSHDVELGGGEDGRPTPLNDLGQLVFQAHWQDPGAGAFRSGIFMATTPCEAEACRDADARCKRCGQPVGQGDEPAASDALGVLRAAVGSQACAPCVCDVDRSGTVAATDALVTLKRAVGQVVELDCPAAA